MRDAQTAKPQSFQTGDGWFAYNLGCESALRKPSCRTPETLRTCLHPSEEPLTRSGVMRYTHRKATSNGNQSVEPPQPKGCFPNCIATIRPCRANIGEADEQFRNGRRRRKE